VGRRHSGDAGRGQRSGPGLRQGHLRGRRRPDDQPDRPRQCSAGKRGRSGMTTVAGRGALVEGEFVFTAEDFRHIAQTLHAHAGIALSEGKAALVYSRLAKRLRLLGLRSFRDYCALIDGAQGVDERQAMMAALTTNVTRFYREPHHFDHLRDKVMPELAAKARAGGRVRLWSAACSNGQEPYSMAMTVLDVLPEAAD